MLTNEVVTLSKGAAGSALQRFWMQDLVAFDSFTPSDRSGPPHQLYKLTKRGHAALAAHRAAVAAFNAAMKE
jgi:predicted ArsR family transcriptional regulator